MADGTIIVTVEGIEYRGLPAVKIREILKDREDLKLIREAYGTLQKNFEDYKSNAVGMQADLTNIIKLKDEKYSKEVNFWKMEFDKEKYLRVKFQTTLEKCNKFLFWRVC